MKHAFLTALLLLLYAGATAQNCPPNIDFETGRFDNWECFTGSVDTMPGRNVITLSASSPQPTRHEIIDSALELIDPYGGFPQVCPYGGRYSVKLGNDNTGAEAEGISFTFRIPPNADTFAITYYYAVVFEDPGHTPIEQPRFFVSAYDVLTGRLIDCASYDYISNGSIPGFEVSPASSTVLYKEWTPSSIDFSGLAGREVRLEFKTADCTRTGHFGYAYLDVGTGCGGLMAVGAYCIETNSVTLNAPYGFQTYTWYNNNYTTIIGNTRTVTLTPPPSINSMFHVDMIPYPGYGCRDTADAILTVLPVPAPPVVDAGIGYCQYDFPSKLAADKLPGYELLWYTTAAGGTPLSDAPVPSTAAPGVTEYWVTQKKFFGCESPRAKISVTVSPRPVMAFTVNDQRQCLNGNRFVFTSTTTNVVDSTIYAWDFGDGSKDTGQVVAHVYSLAGQYNVNLEVTNPPFCVRNTFQSVFVIEKPVADFGYPPVICEKVTPLLFTNNSYTPGGLSVIASSWWNLGNTVYTSSVPPAVTALGGDLPVKLVVTNSDGCRSDTNSQVLHIHYAPIPAFGYNTVLCENEVIQFNDQSLMPAASVDKVIRWNWNFDNQPAFTVQHPATLLPAGLHRISLEAESDIGCKWGTADSILVVHPKPSVALHISDSCAFRNILYTANTLTSVPVSKWFWNFGYGMGEGGNVMTRRFTMEGYNPLKLIGQTSFGCKDTLVRPFSVYYNRSRAEHDTIAAKDQAVQLFASNAENIAWYRWTPAAGLSATDIQNPVAVYDQDMMYELNTMTKQGCDSYSRIFVKRFKGPELYVASAFTPNNDHNNDVLHVFPVGIKSFGYFAIYNRAGVLLFKTTDYKIGWDGTYKGAFVDPGNFVWEASAVDYNDTLLFRKGNVVMIR